jgi:hypothetical protein
LPAECEFDIDPTPHASMGKFRSLIAFLFVIAAMVCGFATGAHVGTRVFIPPIGGLAGPFMVLGYGLIGAAMAGAVALVPALKLHTRTFFALSAIVIAAGTVLAVVIARSDHFMRAGYDAELASQGASLPSFNLRVTYRSGIEKAPFRVFDYDGDTDNFHVFADDGTSCSGTVSATSRERLTLLVALRHVEELLTRESAPCAVGAGDVAAELTFQIREHEPPDTAGDLAISPACLARYRELNNALTTVERVYESVAGDCR